MIPAIYARKSTAQAGSDAKSESAERQIGFATRKGSTVDDAHVYFDDGSSGAELGDCGPGLARLLNALRPQPRSWAMVTPAGSGAWCGFRLAGTAVA